MDEHFKKIADQYPVLYSQAQQIWRHLERNIVKEYPTDRSYSKVCPFVPRTFPEFVLHHIEMDQAEEKERLRLLDLQAVYTTLVLPPWMVKQPWGFNNGYGIDASRGHVLGELTIWTIYQPECGPPGRQHPEWPCMAEMMWEGDQRVATENGRYGRYPPIPRQCTDGPME